MGSRQERTQHLSDPCGREHGHIPCEHVQCGDDGQGLTRILKQKEGLISEHLIL